MPLGDKAAGVQPAAPADIPEGRHPAYGVAKYLLYSILLQLFPSP